MKDAETPTIESQLADIRAQRAAAQHAREQREDERRLRAELEAETRALADERALDAALEQHGELGRHIAAVPTDMGMIIVQRPSALKFRRFQDRGSFKTADITELVRPCVVHPTAAEFDRILDELPATLTTIAHAVATLAGQRSDELAKK